MGAQTGDRVQGVQATLEDRDSGRGWRPRDEMGLSEGDSGSGRRGHKDCEGMGTRRGSLHSMGYPHFSGKQPPLPGTRCPHSALTNCTPMSKLTSMSPFLICKHW